MTAPRPTCIRCGNVYGSPRTTVIDNDGPYCDVCDSELGDGELNGSAAENLVMFALLGGVGLGTTLLLVELISGPFR